MRKVASVAGVLGVVTLAWNAAAIPTEKSPVQPPQAPPPQVVPAAPTVHVVGFRNLHKGAYTGGPIVVEVDLVNDGPATATVSVRLAHILTMLEKTVEVPSTARAGSTRPVTKVTFTEPKGVEESCSPHSYFITLQGPAADTRLRNARVTPSCSFSTVVDDPWNHMTPDRAEDAKAGKAFVSNVVVETAPSCSVGMKLKATVLNMSSKGGSSIIASAKVGESVKAQSIAFALPAGASKDASLGLVPGVSGDVDVTIFDPTHNLTPAIANHAITVKVARACTLDQGTLSP
jgi:hypothetical protein